MNVNTLLEYGMTPDQVAALKTLPPDKREYWRQRGKTKYQLRREAGFRNVTAVLSDDTAAAIDALAQANGMSRKKFVEAVLDRVATLDKVNV